MPRRLPNPPYVIDVVTGCWNWLGCLRKGYAMINNPDYCGIGKKMLQASVYFWTKAGRYIPKDHVLDHKCRNRKCVNLDHLEAVTEKINIRRGFVAKITLEQAVEIRLKYKLGDSQVELSELYKISQATVSQIVRGITWNG